MKAAVMARKTTIIAPAASEAAPEVPAAPATEEADIRTMLSEATNPVVNGIGVETAGLVAIDPPPLSVARPWSPAPDGMLPGAPQLGGVQLIPLSDLHESPWNPRTIYPEVRMRELIASMRANGFRSWQPMLVRPRPEGGYEIGAGHRRRRAAEAAGITEIPCTICDLSDDEFRDILDFDNSQREDPHPLDEAAGWRARMERTGEKVADIARRIGKSPEYVYQRRKYADLIPEAAQAFLEEKFTAGHAILIARRTPEQQELALGFLEMDEYGVNNHELPSTRELEAWLRRAFCENLSRDLFDQNDAMLVPEAGSCGLCPKRLANDPGYVHVPGDQDLCADPKCYDRKVDAAEKLTRIETPEPPKKSDKPETPSAMAAAIVSRAAKAAPTGPSEDPLSRAQAEADRKKKEAETAAKEALELEIRRAQLDALLAKMGIRLEDIDALWRALHETTVIDSSGSVGILKLARHYKAMPAIAKIRMELEEAAKAAEGGKRREVRKANLAHRLHSKGAPAKKSTPAPEPPKVPETKPATSPAPKKAPAKKTAAPKKAARKAAKKTPGK
jgi:ParB/RepB/Spo0J family partition protein